MTDTENMTHVDKHFLHLIYNLRICLLRKRYLFLLMCHSSEPITHCNIALTVIQVLAIFNKNSPSILLYLVGTSIL